MNIISNNKIVSRPNYMENKELKIYAEKGDFKGFIATICVKNNKLVIYSRHKKFKDELEKSINELIKSGESSIGYAQPRYIRGGYSKIKFTIDDYQYLDGLRFSLIHKEFNGYKIISQKTKIIEKFPENINYLDAFNAIKNTLPNNNIDTGNIDLSDKNLFQTIRSITDQMHSLYPSIESLNSSSEDQFQPADVFIKSTKERARKEKLLSEFIKYFELLTTKRGLAQKEIFKKYLEKVKKNPFLSIEEEKKLANEFISNPAENREARKKLVISNLKTIIPIITRFIKSYRTDEKFGGKKIFKKFYTDQELILFSIGVIERADFIAKDWITHNENNVSFSDFLTKDQNNRRINYCLIYFYRQLLVGVFSDLREYIFELDNIASRNKSN